MHMHMHTFQERPHRQTAGRGCAAPRSLPSRAAMVRASQNAQTAKPLELGAQLLCRWRDTEVKPCEVLERQQNEDTGDWEYCAAIH
jgi:hypothetical protein